MMNIHVMIILLILRISGRKRNVNRKYILSIHVGAMVRQKFDRSWNELSTFYLPARLTTINHFATRNIKGVQTRAYVSSSLFTRTWLRFTHEIPYSQEANTRTRMRIRSDDQKLRRNFVRLVWSLKQTKSVHLRGIETLILKSIFETDFLLTYMSREIFISVVNWTCFYGCTKIFGIYLNMTKL